MEGSIPEVPFVDYMFGDLYIGCSCGSETLFLSGVEGIQLEPLVATNKHTLKIVCPICKHELSLFYKEAKDIEMLKAQREVLQVETLVEDEVVKDEIVELGAIEDNDGSGSIETA